MLDLKTEAFLGIPRPHTSIQKSSHGFSGPTFCNQIFFYQVYSKLSAIMQVECYIFTYHLSISE